MAGRGTAHLGPAEESLLRLADLHVRFPSGRGTVYAVTDVSLDIRRGETLGLVGESGCGKSTTGRAIMQLPRPTEGTVVYDGKDLTDLSGEDLRSTRTKLQMIFQDPISSLNPRRRVEDIVAEGLRIWAPVGQPVALLVAGIIAMALALVLMFTGPFLVGLGLLVVGAASIAVHRGGIVAQEQREPKLLVGGLVALALAAIAFFVVGGTLMLLLLVVGCGLLVAFLTGAGGPPVPAHVDKVDEVLEAVGLDPATARGRRPHQFSGGQCQRISIARAVVTEPDLIICDEPVSALDVSVQAQILNLLENLKQRYGLTLVFIAHDLAVVKNVSDRVAVMYLGRLCEVGPPDVLYETPAHPYTEALLGAIPEPNPDQAEDQQEPLSGELPSPLAPPSGCHFRTRCPRADQRCTDEVPEMASTGDGRFVACHHPLVETAVGVNARSAQG